MLSGGKSVFCINGIAPKNQALFAFRVMMYHRIRAVSKNRQIENAHFTIAWNLLFSYNQKGNVVLGWTRRARMFVVSVGMMSLPQWWSVVSCGQRKKFVASSWSAAFRESIISQNCLHPYVPLDDKHIRQGRPRCPFNRLDCSRCPWVYCNSCVMFPFSIVKSPSFDHWGKWRRIFQPCLKMSINFLMMNCYRKYVSCWRNCTWLGLLQWYFFQKLINYYGYVKSYIIATIIVLTNNDIEYHW